jgi:heparosan-N-sulfate-glucuronate 5-epimerase
VNKSIVRNYAVFLVITLIAGVITGLSFPFFIVEAQTSYESHHHNVNCDKTNLNINIVNNNKNKIPKTETQQLEDNNRDLNGNTDVVNSLLTLDKKIVNICLNGNPASLEIFGVKDEDFIVQPFFVKELDNDGIPSVYYGAEVNGKPIGFQRNPVTAALQANEFYDKYKENNDESSKTYFLNNVNWLVDNAVNKGDYSLLQYNFPLPTYNVKPPWFSALANGLALQVLIKAHEITHDVKYLTAAKSLLNAFFIEVEDGGITYKDSSAEWWYEEYASNDKSAKISRVLNGMLFTVLGIYDYFEYTNDPDAKLLFDKGVNSIKKEISKYNDNGYSYYDLLGNPSNKYHQIHVDLTKQLYDLTGEPIFNEYYHLWKNYLS